MNRQIEIAVEALQFYGDPRSWVDMAPSAIQADGGRLASQALKAVEAAGWQPIETAPKDRGILLFEASTGIIVTAIWTENDQRWANGCPAYNPRPTHWAEMLEIPR